MDIQKVSLAEVAQVLTEPYSLVELAYVDDFVARLFICQGSVAWHKHIDQDELFLIHEGEVSLESEWGNCTLRAGEMVVVPKGVTHRSGSLLRSVVLLFERRLFADRQNGQRRLFVLKGQGTLNKADIKGASRGLAPFFPLELARVDNFTAHLMVCRGASKWLESNYDQILLTQRGKIRLETEKGKITLEEGELAHLPREVDHRLVAPGRAVALLLSRRT